MKSFEEPIKILGSVTDSIQIYDKWIYTTEILENDELKSFDHPNNLVKQIQCKSISTEIVLQVKILFNNMAWKFDLQRYWVI